MRNLVSCRTPTIGLTTGVGSFVGLITPYCRFLFQFFSDAIWNSTSGPHFGFAIKSMSYSNFFRQPSA